MNPKYLEKDESVFAFGRFSLVGLALLLATAWPLAAVELDVGDIVVTAGESPDEDVVHIDPLTGLGTVIASASDPLLEGPFLSVLVEPSGTILVGFFGGNSLHSIARIDPSDGTSSVPFGGTYALDAWDMAFDSVGRLLVLSHGYSSISRIDVQTGGVAIVSAGGLISLPSSLAVEASGTILVANANEVGSVVRIDPDTGGQTLLMSSSNLRYPSGIAVAKSGEIFVVAESPIPGVFHVANVDPVSGDETVLSEGGLLEFPTSIVVDNDGSILVNSGGGGGIPLERVVRIDRVSGDQSAVSLGTSSSGWLFFDIDVVRPFSCSATPSSSCAASPKSRITMKGSTTNPKIVWKWTNGTTSLAEIGQPNMDTDYALCAYLDGARVIGDSISSGGTCDGRPCWKATGATGYRYKSRDGNADGVTKVKLREGDGKAKILIKGSGDNLNLPTLPMAFGGNLLIQLVRADGAGCWESNFTSFQRNDEFLFKAKLP